MIENIKTGLQSFLPRGVYRHLLLPYHLAWTLFMAVKCRFPARDMVVIGVTGTKGKSSVSEMLAAVLEAAGHTVAVSSTIHFRIGKESYPNLFKMTLPGRGFIQEFLADAKKKRATHAVIEITSEAALQYRHLFLYQNVLVFTGLEKEHIESHGGMHKYHEAKLRIARALARSPKRPRAVIANKDNFYGRSFLDIPVEARFPFSLEEAHDLKLTPTSTAFTYKEERFSLAFPGEFTARNALAAIKLGEFLGIPLATIREALASLTVIRGRAESVDCGQDFLAVVDYAHTPGSLEALYKAYEGRRLICVLGNTGGGRDTWKRPEMGRIAEQYCDTVILTDEDPYDENPEDIVNAMASAMERKPEIIMDRRTAIARALEEATAGDAVLITGKGTDPYIMRAQGAKESWSDARVVREELEKRTARSAIVGA